MTVYASGSSAQTFDFQGGDVGYVPRSVPHYIENTGATRLRYLDVWQSDHFEDMSLAQWLALTPYELVKAHLNIERLVLSKVSGAVVSALFTCPLTVAGLRRQISPTAEASAESQHLLGV